MLCLYKRLVTLDRCVCTVTHGRKFIAFSKQPNLLRPVLMILKHSPDLPVSAVKFPYRMRKEASMGVQRQLGVEQTTAALSNSTRRKNFDFACVCSCALSKPVTCCVILCTYLRAHEGILVLKTWLYVNIPRTTLQLLLPSLFSPNRNNHLRSCTLLLGLPVGHLALDAFIFAHSDVCQH